MDDGLNMNFSSKLIEDSVNAFATLPGIGKKTALRLTLHLLNMPTESTESLCEPVLKMRNSIQFCATCHNISDEAVCSICSDRARDRSVICVVESIRDIMAIENTNQYRGLFHILGGVISPIEGVGPAELNINSLIERVKKEEVKEIIMAISPTIDGETTIFYLSKQLAEFPVNVTTLARGISFGGELEYADELTLGRSIASRRPYGQ